MLRKVLKDFFRNDVHFRNLVMEIPVSVMVVRGPEFRVEFINNRLLVAFQKSWDDMYGKPFFQLFPELSGQGYEEIFRKVFETGQTYMADIVPISVPGADVQLQYIKLSVQPLVNPVGKITGLFIVGSDVTEMVKSRQQLAENEAGYRAVLEQEVAQRTRELEQSNNDLRQFTHLISHDLKEPVRKVKIFSTILANELKDKLDDDQWMYMKKIISANDRLHEMIEAIYDYSFSDFNTDKITDVDLNHLLSVLVDDMDASIHRNNAMVIIHWLPVVRGISIELYQLFYNLLSNALKFSRSDIQPRIEISSSISHENHSKYVVIKVTDNGIGFEDCYREKIFNSFTRLHPKDKYEGTGLGLSLSRKIVTRHGGTIEASSELNIGTTITIKLPV